MENIDKKAETRRRLADAYKQKSKENNKKIKKDKIELLVEKLEACEHLSDMYEDIVKSLIKQLKQMSEEPDRSDTIVINFLEKFI